MKFRKMLFYVTAERKRPFLDWLMDLDIQVRGRIEARLDRMAGGNAGDYRAVGEGVFEMRLHFGPGYRVYYAYDGQEFVLLLLAGDKSSQPSDIKKAKFFWQDYQRRKE
ncbi:MAG TPA: addiction module killer protein [Candidatus Omnitrophica bacterium]|nr:addiction module killer protein [Candidatus Omnitrophota bacterium]